MFEVEGMFRLIGKKEEKEWRNKDCSTFTRDKEECERYKKAIKEDDMFRYMKIDDLRLVKRFTELPRNEQLKKIAEDESDDWKYFSVSYYYPIPSYHPACCWSSQYGFFFVNFRFTKQAGLWCSHTGPSAVKTSYERGRQTPRFDARIAVEQRTTQSVDATIDGDFTYSSRVSVCARLMLGCGKH